tara:strand:- start:1205 stop:1429 length:225 start_codon:yes stop_codon:yes gene_type:complete
MAPIRQLMVRLAAKIMSQTKDIIAKWYPIIIALICLLYSVGLGLAGHSEDAQYSAHWPGTILLFAIAIRQRRRS